MLLYMVLSFAQAFASANNCPSITGQYLCTQQVHWWAEDQSKIELEVDIETTSETRSGNSMIDLMISKDKRPILTIEEFFDSSFRVEEILEKSGEYREQEYLMRAFCRLGTSLSVSVFDKKRSATKANFQFFSRNQQLQKIIWEDTFRYEFDCLPK